MLFGRATVLRRGRGPWSQSFLAAAHRKYDLKSYPDVALNLNYLLNLEYG